MHLGSHFDSSSHEKQKSIKKRVSEIAQCLRYLTHNNLIRTQITRSMNYLQNGAQIVSI